MSPATPLLSMVELHRRARHLRQENAQYPDYLVEVPRAAWPEAVALGCAPTKVWRSNRFCVMEFHDSPGDTRRLSVCRTAINPDGSWKDGITWDELQALKRQAGYADRWAVEIYPPDLHVVNVGNLRHLWIWPEKPACGWTTGGAT
jgi:hypothetical protein